LGVGAGSQSFSNRTEIKNPSCAPRAQKGFLAERNLPS
jgi:hypothetical protein